MMSFEICESKKEDLEKILELIKELAIHENMLEDVKCTTKELEESFFENKYAKALSLKVDGKIIGYAMYYFTFSSFWGLGGLYLEDIYIQAKYRKKGYAKAVFKYLAQICKEKNLKRLEWVCLNDNDLGIEFYTKLNAKHMNEWRTYRLEGENLEVLM
ncbi:MULTISPECIES: GNAT family N-acetyltransferase [Campylobacter]|uniref:GNAT family N-acetyltransferase n=1 Tax=Campylobacter TaxID=194 RepID=UPI001FB74E4E|nr:MULTISPECIES: GNAT family N-acetyltransferase [Campylobacter]MCR8708255.1 GNAT family N-acetyltransferase [Campylobacter sp. RM5063]MCV3403540.1 GNAT family N-acetyltransferase [Campylobacter sp. IFREMER_LSEM_CL2090]MCV3409536.1 GNAT family N-acetyltransferase [Campylobacter sp. IFREMER_LSEM_CL1890]MCW0186009.1 GNAT family N-acetyltransferase [Campylobacter lari]